MEQGTETGPPRPGDGPRAGFAQQVGKVIQSLEDSSAHSEMARSSAEPDRPRRKPDWVYRSAGVTPPGGYWQDGVLLPQNRELPAPQRKPTQGELAAMYDREEYPQGWCFDCMEPGHLCDQCHDRYAVRRAQSRPGDVVVLGDLVVCDCVRGTAGKAAESTEEVLDRMHLDPALRDCYLETYEPQSSSMVAGCRDYVSRWPTERPFLVLYGPPGTGKSHLAAGVMRDLYERFGVRSRMWNMPFLLDRLRATAHEDGVETVDAIDRELAAWPLLVLDDYGVGRSDTAFAAERVYMIVQRRYAQRQPLIITSNVDIDGWEQRTRDRLTDAAYSRLIDFSGIRSYRATRKAQVQS